MVSSSKHLFLSVSTKTHASGVVMATCSRDPDTPKHRIIRLKPLHTTAGSLTERPVLNAPIKAQRKRPRHDPDSESDGNDSEAEFLGSRKPSAKRLRRVDSAASRGDAQVQVQSRESSGSRSRANSLEPFPTFDSLPDPYATEEDLQDLAALNRTPLRAAGDLLLRVDAAHEGGFTQHQVAWATFMVKSLLIGSQTRLSDLFTQYQELIAQSISYDDVMTADFDLADDPIIKYTAAMGCWLFRDDTSPHAEPGAVQDLTAALLQLRQCMAKTKGLEIALVCEEERRN